MRAKVRKFTLTDYLVLTMLTLLTMLVCLSVGSVALPLDETLATLAGAVFGWPADPGIAGTIILSLRLPRVFSVALVGAALSLAGAAMQGLLRNPLADGSTLGVSSGASLGAVLALALGITLPGLPQLGTMGMAMLFAFLSLALILSLAWKIDASLATNTIILIGVIFSMFAGSLISLMIAFSGEKLRSITFWTMGSLSGTGYTQVITLLIALLLSVPLILSSSRELDAFAMGEDNAHTIGVNVRGVKLRVLITVSALIGVCVSIGGTIGFVGLVTPHMTRMVVGPAHPRLLPASMFAGAIFLMLADLLARTIASPIELPLGVITSFIGAILFVLIFFKSRRAR
jgi:iron complex transport system permease protein